jgi:hypothetical protein
MAYFNSLEIAAIAVFAALWGVLNSIFSPIVFSMTHLPLLCDLIGFAVLTVAAWWIRKFGAITAIGLVATVINFALSPQALLFVGFTAAAFVFDLSSGLTGYSNFFANPQRTTTAAIGTSTLSAVVAGFTIGLFLMTGSALSAWGGVSGWMLLHAVGGVIGGAIGASLVVALNSRKVTTNSQKPLSSDMGQKSSLCLFIAA